MNLVKFEDCNLFLKSGEKLLYIPEFSVDSGESVFISGMNGVGKSTFFKIITGFLDDPEDQYAYIEGSSIFMSNLRPDVNSKIIYVPQDDYISLPYRSVRDVLKEGFLFQKCNREEAVENWLNNYNPFVGNERKDFLKKRVKQLSGGQKKYLRILQSLERCESSSVRLIILDEPINHLDAYHIASLSNMILRILEQNKGLSVLISSHCHAFPFISKAYEIVNSKLIHQSYRYFNCFGLPDEKGFYNI